MTSQPIPFEEIVQRVQDDTGIQNLSNEIETIKRMVVYAEKEINPYSGFLTKKKMIYYKKNGVFDGQKIKKPSDFVELHDVELECNSCSYYQTINHIIVCGDLQDKITFTYWAIQYDNNGNPIISGNHGEAVVCYIVWKLYSQKAFNGDGSHQVRKDYRQEFFDAALEARGEDMFPSEESLNQISHINNTEKLRLFETRIGEDQCVSEECFFVFDEEDSETNPTPVIERFFYYQFPDTSSGLSDLDPIDLDFLINNGNEIQKTSFLNEGEYLSFSNVGRFIVCISTKTTELYGFSDVLGNQITDSVFDYVYDSQKEIEFFVSKNYYVPGTSFLKLIQK